MLADFETTTGQGRYTGGYCAAHNTYNPTQSGITAVRTWRGSRGLVHSASTTPRGAALLLRRILVSHGSNGASAWNSDSVVQTVAPGDEYPPTEAKTR